MRASKKKGSDTTNEEYLDKNSATNLTEAAIEVLCDQKREAIDPFDEYTFLLRSRFHADARTSGDRLMHGYNILIKELSKIN